MSNVGRLLFLTALLLVLSACGGSSETDPSLTPIAPPPALPDSQPVTLINPLDGVSTNGQPILSWVSNGAQSYSVQIRQKDSESTFSEHSWVYHGLPEDASEVSLSLGFEEEVDGVSTGNVLTKLEGDVVYEWQVISTIGDHSSISDTRTLTADIRLPPPPTLKLVSALNSLQPEFSWKIGQRESDSALGFTSHFNIQLSAERDFTRARWVKTNLPKYSVATDWNSGEGWVGRGEYSMQEASNFLEPGQRYYWRVLAFNEFGATQSATGIFDIPENAIEGDTKPNWSKWIRATDQDGAEYSNHVFFDNGENNHDPILFYDASLEYPYQLIISHEPSHAYHWQSKTFSPKAELGWELSAERYYLAMVYEFDDGVKVDGVHYVFKNGIIYSYSGSLEEANGSWLVAGTWPYYDGNGNKLSHDVGVFYEDNLFHIFGEYGDFPHGPDGISLSHYVSSGPADDWDWELVTNKAVDPNPDGSNTYGVGDATIIKIKDEYYLFSDIESLNVPYRVITWRTKNIFEPFEYVGLAVAPRTNDANNPDFYRVQDCDIIFAPEEGRYVMMCNVLQDSNNRRGTRRIGVYYSSNFDCENLLIDDDEDREKCRNLASEAHK